MKSVAICESTEVLSVQYAEKHDEPEKRSEQKAGSRKKKDTKPNIRIKSGNKIGMFPATSRKTKSKENRNQI